MNKDYYDDSKPDFFKQVFQVAAQIPFGRVTSYGAIAKYLSVAKSSRMVGFAMNASHSLKNNLPAHRVVNRNGLLTGKNHFNTPTEMENKLKNEGILIINDQIQDFENVFWDPKELDY